MFSALYRQLDLLVAIAMAVAITDLRFVLSSPVLVPGIAFLDHSWGFDFVVKARQGVWLGDSVTFTYGPLFQLASAAPVNLMGGSLGAFYRTWLIPQFWTAILLTSLTGRLLLGGHSPWKRSFYLLALVGFWGALNVRFCYDFFVFAVALRYFDRVLQTKRFHPAWAATVGLLAWAGFLVSADTGVYSTAAVVIAGVSHLLVHRSEGSARSALLHGAAAVGVTFTVLVLLTAAFMPHARFGFWTNSLEIVSQYRWSMAYPMDKPIKWRLIWASSISLLILVVGYRWRDSLSSSLARRPAFFPAAILFSLLTVQSATVRSDWDHVFLALLPSVALAGAVLMGGGNEARSNWRSDLPLIATFVLTAAFSGPLPQLRPRNVLAGLRLPEISRSETCPPEMFYLDEVCLSRRDYEPLRAVSEYLSTHLSESESVAIFPYENMYSDVARRRVAGGVLQNYQIAGERLVRRQLDGLERDQPPLAVYSADGLATLGLDAVPNFTRTPEVWLYLQSRFTTQAELAPGIVVLGRDEGRLREWRTEVTTIGKPLETAIRMKHAMPIPLDYWPADHDFLKLRVRVDYPAWWRLTKPSAPSITIRHTDGSKENFRLALPPNTTTDVWIYPWDESQLLHYFDKSEAGWRVGRPRAPVSAVFLEFQGMDWLSSSPVRLNIYAVDAVRLRLNDSR